VCECLLDIRCGNGFGKRALLIGVFFHGYVPVIKHALTKLKTC